MNVCLVSGYANFSGGLENVVSELKNYLVQQKVDVTVCAEEKPSYLPESLKTLYYRRSNFHKLPYSLSTYRKLQSGFDIIHGHGDNCFFPSLLRDRTPLIITFHGVFPRTTPKNLLNDPRTLPSLYAERTAAARCDIAVACSNAVKEEIKEHYNAKNIVVIHNGIDTDKFAPSDKQQARKRLHLPISPVYTLWVGRDPVRKGLNRAIEALKEYPEIHLIVAGCTVPLTKNVTCLGSIASNVLMDAYNAADFLFFPTTYEGFPVAPMEALACGLPILVSKESNMGEIIRRGVHGFIVDDECYGDKINLLLDEHMRSKMAVECRNLALQYSWQQQANKYLELYRRLSN